MTRLETLTLDLRGPALWATFSRPQSMNALDPAMLIDLTQAVDEAEAGSARVLVLTGTASAFCAGANLKFVQMLGGDAERLVTELLDPLTAVLRRIRQSPYRSSPRSTGIASRAALKWP